MDPIKIFSALTNKSGPYAPVVDAVGKIELDLEYIADKHEDTVFPSTSDEDPLLQPSESEVRWLGDFFGTDFDNLNKE